MRIRALEEMAALRRNFDRLFESLHGAGTSPLSTLEPSELAFVPAVETVWTHEAFHLRFILPGVSGKDIHLAVHGQQLHIHGERKEPEDFARGGYVYNRMPYGRFERVVDLPAGPDLDKLTARIKDGVLDVRIPVVVRVRPREVEISMAETEPETVDV